jgi:hypothetical protein
VKLISTHQYFAELRMRISINFYNTKQNDSRRIASVSLERSRRWEKSGEESSTRRSAELTPKKGGGTMCWAAISLSAITSYRFFVVC